MTSKYPLASIEELGPDIGFAEAQAAALYGRDYRKALASDDGFQRLDAVERLARARAALSVQEVAAMDMAAGRGHALAEIIRLTGRETAFVEALVLAACAKLAAHYEAVGDADDDVGPGPLRLPGPFL
ncbi:hypothetical protein J2800_002626 [Caulobacter rhizosphaerae]|uniref:Uncharacterized protein n=1 Tax=Caulobacter rhizosphaerae TaxID=2010972 RepID=A0ABU1N0B4_9CAUL|nr:hypothetical protein [Caulobacter rhizosphaerae]MDR6531873.1 hypothetical protein [Caulobacter rhizosphaerae]